MSDAEFDNLAWVDNLNEQTAFESGLVLRDVLHSMSLLKDRIFIPPHRPIQDWRLRGSIEAETSLTTFRNDVIQMLVKRGVLRSGEYYHRYGPDDLRAVEGYYVDADEAVVEDALTAITEHLNGGRRKPKKPRKPKPDTRSQPKTSAASTPAVESPSPSAVVVSADAAGAHDLPAVHRRSWLKKVGSKIADEMASSVARWIVGAAVGGVSLVFPQVRHLLFNWLHAIVGVVSSPKTSAVSHAM